MLEINSYSNINFRGAFRIKPSETLAQKEIPELFTQGRQIFNNILEKGDKVIVLRDNYDKRVGNYIREKNLQNIEYYPQINTKSGLDSEEPQGLLNLINDKTKKVITQLDEIFLVISGQKKDKKPRKTPNIEKEVRKISNALRLNIENPKILSNKKSTIIRDDDKKRTIEIIGLNKATSYVYLKPDSLSESSTRCIIDGKGNLVKKFETPNEILKFLKLFNKLKKDEINILV